MPPFNTLTSLLLLSSALIAHAKVTQQDFTGIGNIFVLNSSDWRTASPDQKVGCLDNNGRFIKDESKSDCGTFTRLDDYPYTLSSTKGNCTFNDENTEKNTDSYYGKRDHAWTCNATYKAVIYDELYTIVRQFPISSSFFLILLLVMSLRSNLTVFLQDGFNYTFLCSGDINCYYDSKKIPSANEKVSLWPFRWGSEQRGITPGHVMLQLMWSKLGDLPKREGVDRIPGPRVELRNGLQVPLQGQQIK